MTGHRCPGPACPHLVPSTMLMCRAHWYAVPKPLRDEVWRAYKALGAHGGIGLVGGAGDQIRSAQREACRKAIESLREAEPAP